MHVVKHASRPVLLRDSGTQCMMSRRGFYLWLFALAAFFHVVKRAPNSPRLKHSSCVHACARRAQIFHERGSRSRIAGVPHPGSCLSVCLDAADVTRCRCTCLHRPRCHPRCPPIRQLRRCRSCLPLVPPTLHPRSREERKLTA